MRLAPLALVCLLAACSPAVPLAPEAVPGGTRGGAPAQISPDATAILRAIDQFDVAAAGAAVQNLLADSGFDLWDDLSWDVQAFDEPINYYATGLRSVTISQIPTAEQAPRYWEVWSDLLTGGTWDPDVFFADAEEARVLAGLNQAYLAAHELGHAAGYRYAVTPRFNREGNTNCGELLADRLAAAVLDSLASTDDRFRALRPRYLALFASLNAAIPEPSRYALAPEAATMDGCDAVHVAYVSDPASLAPYASAFFERHRLLHARGPEPLASLRDGLFLARLRAFRQRHPLTERRVSSETVGTVEIDGSPVRDPEDLTGWVEISIDFVRSMSNGDAESDTLVSVAPVIGPTGTVWGVGLQSFGDIFTGDFNSAWVVRDARGGELVWSPDSTGGLVQAVQSAVALTDRVFLALVAETSSRESSVVSHRLYRLDLDDDNGLSITVSDPVHSAASGDILPLPNGIGLVEGDSTYTAFDMETLALGPDPVPGDATPGDLIGMDLAQHAFVAAHRAIGSQQYEVSNVYTYDGGGVLLRYRGGETYERLAGSGYPRTTDASGADAIEFQHIDAVRAISPTEILVVEDRTFTGEGRVLRRLILE